MRDRVFNHRLVACILDAWPGAEVSVNGVPALLDLTPNEITAIVATSEPAGAYLESIGKTDLAAMSQDEWMGFLEAVVSAYADKMAEFHGPHAVLRSADDPIQANEVPY